MTVAICTWVHLRPTPLHIHDKKRENRTIAVTSEKWSPIISPLRITLRLSPGDILLATPHLVIFTSPHSYWCCEYGGECIDACIYSHPSLTFIRLAHLFCGSCSLDLPALFALFTRVTVAKMAFVCITCSILPFPCHTYASFQFVCPQLFPHYEWDC